MRLQKLIHGLNAGQEFAAEKPCRHWVICFGYAWLIAADPNSL